MCFCISPARMKAEIQNHEMIMRGYMSTYDYGSPFNDENVVELLRYAIVEGEQNARLRLQQYLGDVVRGWLRQHPRRESLYCLVNEEYYVAATFKRFWQLTFDRQFEFSTFDSVM